jgi:hypothetical protein
LIFGPFYSSIIVSLLKYFLFLLFRFMLLLILGRLRPAAPYIGNLQATRGAYVGNFGYQQPVSYSYQQGLMYPPYGYVVHFKGNSLLRLSVFEFQVQTPNL